MSQWVIIKEKEIHPYKIVISEKRGITSRYEEKLKIELFEWGCSFFGTKNCWRIKEKVYDSSIRGMSLRDEFDMTCKMVKEEISMRD